MSNLSSIHKHCYEDTVTAKCNFLFEQILATLQYNATNEPLTPFLVWFEGAHMRVDIEPLSYEKIKLTFHGMNDGRKRNEGATLPLDYSLKEDSNEQIAYDQQACALFKEIVTRNIPEITHIGFCINSREIVIKDFLEGVKTIPTDSRLHLEIGEIFDFDPLYLPEFSAHPNIRIFRYSDELKSEGEVAKQEDKQIKLGEESQDPGITVQKLVVHEGNDPESTGILEAHTQDDNIATTVSALGRMEDSIGDSWEVV